MTRLLITRGLPASGKTTFARKLQPQVVRVNRDDLRLMLHGGRLFTQWSEGQVTHAQRAELLIKTDSGLEAAAGLGDIFAKENDIGIARHFLCDAASDCVGIADLGHRQFLQAQPPSA